VSRPCGFGKTMAAMMIAEYYMKDLDSSEVFSSLKIAEHPSFQERMNKYNVFFININDFWRADKKVKTMIDEIEADLLADIKNTMNNLPLTERKLAPLLYEVFSLTNNKFVFVIDEWDCVIRNTDPISKRFYLEFLDYILKDRAYVALVYMTGILPVYGDDSTLNMFEKYTMLNPRQLTEYVGFTEAEAQLLCEKNGMDFDLVKLWYDGYKFGELSVYSPRSVMSAIEAKEIENYWTQTEAFNSLKSYISADFDGMREAVLRLVDEPGSKIAIDPNTFPGDARSLASKDDALTMLVHLGYLGFDRAKKEVFAPNKEVLEQFAGSVKDPEWSGFVEIYESSKKVLEHTWAMNGDLVAQAIDKIHTKIIDLKKCDSEQAMSYVINWAYIYANKYYNMLKEFASGKGCIDDVFLPKPQFANKPALLIELKWNKSASSALRQIENKDYADKIRELAGDNILLIGINYSKRAKKHTCEIRLFSAPQH
jgi:hypothetical protein